ncbi:hypothetical protein [Streptomyces chartreusis]
MDSIVGARQNLAEVFELHGAGRARVIHEARPPGRSRRRSPGQVKARIVFEMCPGSGPARGRKGTPP